MAPPQDVETIADSNATTSAKDTPRLISFPAGNDDYRYLRKRASILCAAFNAQPPDVSDAERVRAWNDIVNVKDKSDDPNSLTAPLVKGPIHIDYGINVHIHPSCFVNRDCYILDTPESEISIGENTIVGVGARLLGVTHPVDWRERQGRYGVSLAEDVRIGKDCFLGAGVTVLPGVTIGDGCVCGAGSVVTKNVPAYHVAAGNPARLIQKVAADVPDAPDLVYEVDTGRVLCRDSASNQIAHGGYEPAHHGEKTDFKQPVQATQLFVTTPRAGQGRLQSVVLHACALLVGALIGYWLMRWKLAQVAGERRTRSE